jgi:GNAT superfamily N-acetyltransferase
MDVSIRSGGSAEDVNELVRLHREVYESEYGLEPSFASEVATQMAELRRRGWPGPGEGLWLAESGGEVVGSITLYEVGDGTGRLGHLVLAHGARGSGAGRRLVEHVLEAARAAPYQRLELATFSDLAAAGSLYRSVGFVKVSSEHSVRWGRQMEWQRYELEL